MRKIHETKKVTLGIDPTKWGTPDKPIFEAPEAGRYDFNVSGKLFICMLKAGQRILIDYNAGKIIYL